MFDLRLSLLGVGLAMFVSLTLVVFNSTNFWEGTSYLVAGVLVSGWCVFGFEFENTVSRSLLVGAATMLGVGAFLHNVSNPTFTIELTSETRTYWSNLKRNRKFYGDGFARDVIFKFEEDYLKYCFLEQSLGPVIDAHKASVSVLMPVETSLFDITDLNATEEVSPCMTTIQSLAANAPDWFASNYPNIMATIEIAD